VWNLYQSGSLSAAFLFPAPQISIGMLGFSLSHSFLLARRQNQSTLGKYAKLMAVTIFKINTSKNVSKQRTLTAFRMNT